MKNTVFICCLFISFSYISTTHAQIINPELATASNSCPPTNWYSVGVTSCNLIDIATGWNYSGMPYILSPGHLAPNALPGDRVWVLFENSLGQYGGFSQTVGPLVIGNTYCLKFEATVNRISTLGSTLAVRLDVDNVPQDSHSITYGTPMRTIDLCFTATATSHVLQLRTDLISGLTTFLFIKEGSGSLVAANCQNSVVVTGNPVTTGLYAANTDLSCSDVIDSGSGVTFLAGNEINLTAGFCVPASATFLANIEACL